MSCRVAVLSSTYDSSMVSNSTPESVMPARASTLMSYLRFCPIFAGRSDSRIGRSFASTTSRAIWSGAPA